MVEVGYVGTRGRDLVSRSNGNVMPYGALNSGTFNGIDLSNPVNRVAVASVGDQPVARSGQYQRAERRSPLYDFEASPTTTRCRSR